jgi:hypothetical protein
MSNITRLPPFSKTVHVEADIPVSQRDEFERAIVDIVAGERPRMDALDRDFAAIRTRAMEALQYIEKAIGDHPTTGQARRLVHFLAGLYNGQDYPFDLMSCAVSTPSSLTPAWIISITIGSGSRKFTSISRTAMVTCTAG